MLGFNSRFTEYVKVKKMENNDWPIDNDRKFESEFFTVEELTAKQQENGWLRNRDAEDGVYTDYPTYDYSYGAYECLSIEELKRAFLYGNWAIRQCFTYKNLAFINQMNGGSEWWALKKFEDGTLLAFDSMSMIRIINYERKTWHEDYNTSEYEEGSRFRCILPYVAENYAEGLTVKFHEEEPEYINPQAKYVVGPPRDSKHDFGIYFVDVAQDYFPEWIAQLLKATYKECDGWKYTDEEFDEKYRQPFHGAVRRVLTGKEFKDALA